MGVSSHATLSDISKSYDQLKSNSSAQIDKAYECFKQSECRSEYSRFGSTLQLNDAS